MGNIILFHGTSFKNFLNIIQDKKLIPQKESGAGILFELTKEEIENTYNGFVFFTDDYNLAFEHSQYASDYNLKPKVILEVELNIDNLLPDDSDNIDATTWQQTLKEDNQVKIKGNVSIENIKTINFEGPDFLLKTNLNNWLVDYFNNENKFF